MWRAMLLAALLNLFPLSAAAQRVEVFGGYQFTHLDPAYNASGWNFAVQGNFKHVLGIAADFSGAYKTRLNAHTYAAGPVLTARLPVVQPFVHALFGGMTLSNSGSTTGFVLMLGGGLDIGFRKGIGIRIVQADWVSTHFSGTTDNKNTRVSAGIVLKF